MSSVARASYAPSGSSDELSSPPASSHIARSYAAPPVAEKTQTGAPDCKRERTISRDAASPLTSTVSMGVA